MKRLMLIFFPVIFTIPVYGQQTMLTKYIDDDNIRDSVSYKDKKIEVKLSTQNFKPIKSRFLKDIYFEYATCTIEEDCLGFAFNVEYMGANMMTNNRSCFRYDPHNQRLRLTKMITRISGSGNEVEASVDILKGIFKAKWHLYYRDHSDNSYIHEPLPIIKDTLHFSKMFLEDYDGSVFEKFEKRIDESFDQAQKKGENSNP